MKEKFKKIVSWFALWVMIATNVFAPIVDAASLFDPSKASTSFRMPDHAINLKATSLANIYTIAFDKNTWVGNMSNQTMTYDQTWTLTANSFSKTWWTFQWWNTWSTATTAKRANKANVKNLATTGSITLYAIWKANPYKVTFNANTWVDTINVVNGTMPVQNFVYDTAQALTGNKLTRAWYTFLWWSTWANATTATFADKASITNQLTSTSGANVTLYAVWRANTWVNYTVKHYLMDTNWNYPSTPSYTNTYTGTTYAIVTWAKRNDTWMTLSWSVQSAHLKWDGSTEFKYYYSRDKKTLTVNVGRWVSNVSWWWQKYYNQAVTVSATLKAGYTGLVWTWDKTITSFNMPNSNVTMTASATPITYTITYDVWSGTISWQKPTYNVEEDFTLPNPTRTWYDFAWWTWTNQSTPKTWLTIPAWTYGNLSYTANWTPRWDVTYKVHHMHKKVWVNEYEEKSVDTYTGWVADATLTLANLKKDVDGDCVTYTWWSLTMSTSWLTSPITTTTVLPDGSREIYLYYTRNSYTLTLTKDTWISTAITEWTYECGATINIEATPKTWYHFKTWEVVAPTGWTP